MTEFSDDDWQDLEPPAKNRHTPDVTVRVGVLGRPGRQRARAMIFFRNEPAAWMRDNGPRFRVQIGGDNANGLRIIPDNERGHYEVVEFNGTMRLQIGIVTAWPLEVREATPAKWRVAGPGLVLTLPEDFAKASKAPETPPAPPVPSIKKEPFPITTAAHGLAQASRAIQQTKRRDVSSSLMGDPPASRSALAQRKDGQ